MAVLLAEHGGGHEGCGGVARGEGVVVAAVGALYLGCEFDTLDHAAHDDRRECARRHHASPRTAALYAGGLEAYHHQTRQKLHAVVYMAAILGQIVMAQSAEVGILTLDQQSGCHEGHSDVGHLVESGRGDAGRGLRGGGGGGEGESRGGGEGVWDGLGRGLGGCHECHEYNKSPQTEDQRAMLHHTGYYPKCCLSIITPDEPIYYNKVWVSFCSGREDRRGGGCGGKKSVETVYTKTTIIRLDEF